VRKPDDFSPRGAASPRSTAREGGNGRGRRGAPPRGGAGRESRSGGHAGSHTLAARRWSVLAKKSEPPTGGSRLSRARTGATGLAATRVRPGSHDRRTASSQLARSRPRARRPRKRTRGSSRRDVPRSTDPICWSRPGSSRSRERTPGGSKASKRACRPFTGEPDGHEPDRMTSGLTVAGNPGSRTSRRASFLTGVGLCGARVATVRRPGESDRTRSWPVALATVDREPARKQRARESEHGSPGGEGPRNKLSKTRAAWKKAAKRRGCHGVRRGRPGQVDHARAASTARTVEGGKNPRDGAARVWQPSSSAGASLQRQRRPA
jgi:hypothetical protein